jgi:hypothetical protein
MQVQIDQVWASPSTLHARVIVHDDQGRWRHKYYPSVALEDIPIEAVAPLLAYFDTGIDDPRQLTLFEV